MRGGHPDVGMRIVRPGKRKREHRYEIPSDLGRNFRTMASEPIVVRRSMNLLIFLQFELRSVGRRLRMSHQSGNVFVIAFERPLELGFFDNPNLERQRLGAFLVMSVQFGGIDRRMPIQVRAELLVEREFLRTDLVRILVYHHGANRQLQSKKPGDRGRMEPNAPFERERHDQPGSGGLLIVPVDASVYGWSASRMKQRRYYE